jgi:NAD(P)-dependent dehydrogenase (short-subunit alcohol dehydrogenase family)
VICARHLGPIRKTVMELGDLGRIEGIPADLASIPGIELLVDQVLARTGGVLHILVNNAGTTREGDLADYPESEWDATFTLNVKAAHYLTTALLPLLRVAATQDDPARVINIGSMDAITPMTGNPAYGASKAAVQHLTRIHARALADDNITVNALAPGVFRSQLTETVLDNPEQFRTLVQTIPLHRIGRPEQIGGTAVYLASRAGAFTTGTVLAVDGGITGCG